MKVVHIASSTTGGAGIATLRLHQSLLKENNINSYIIQKADTPPEHSRISISTLYESTDLLYRLKRKLNLTPEKKQWNLIPTFSGNYEYEIATFPTTSYRIENHPLVKGADIIHLHWVANFLNYPTFFKNIKQPIVCTLHDKNPFHGLFHTETDEKNNEKKYGELDKKITEDKIQYLQQAKDLHIVTPSLWLLNKSKQSKALGRFPHICIANSVDLDSCTISHKDAQKKIGVDNEKKTLLFIAHSIDIPRRGFFIMKDALRNLDSSLLNFNLITVGGDKIDLDIDHINHIHYTNTNDVDLLNTIYAASDIQILPTQEDNLPNVMLESFANGTPVISFANGGMAEHIQTGMNGILINQIGVTPLLQALTTYLKDQYTFDRELIKEYAKEHFDEKRQAQKYIELYQNILSQ